MTHSSATTKGFEQLSTLGVPVTTETIFVDEQGNLSARSLTVVVRSPRREHPFLPAMAAWQLHTAPISFSSPERLFDHLMLTSPGVECHSIYRAVTLLDLRASAVRVLERIEADLAADRRRDMFQFWEDDETGSPDDL